VISTKILIKGGAFFLYGEFWERLKAIFIVVT